MEAGEIRVERHAGASVIVLHGEIDISVEPSVSTWLRNAFASCHVVIVDLSDATFIDSIVLRGLIYGVRRAAESPELEFAVVAPGGGVPRRLLALTAFDKMVRVFETRAEAFDTTGTKP